MIAIRKSPSPPLDNASDLVSRLSEIPDLSTLPAVFMRLMSVMRNPHAPINAISRIVEADQSIAMKILRLINSSFYGLPRSVYSVQQAIVLLGANTLRSIVLMASVFEALGKDKQGPELNRNALWQHSIGCGLIARCLGSKVNCGHEEEGFISGIIHDIGKVVLDQYFHDQLLAVMLCVQQQRTSFYRAEMAIMGISHAEIGGKLAEIWNLPANLVAVAAQHHNSDFEGPHAHLVALIQISDMLTRKYGIGCAGDDLVPEVDPLAWQTLGLTPAKLEDWRGDIEVEIAKGRELSYLMPS